MNTGTKPNDLEKQVARLIHAIFPMNKDNLSLSKAKNFLSKWKRPFQTNERANTYQ